MAGLKICTRWRAISARRRRRISSSLFPENIGPTTTSIQPMLPLTMSTPLLPYCALSFVGARYIVPSGRSQDRPLQKLPRSLCRRTVQFPIVERREGRDHCQAERLLPRDEIVAQDAPGALAVADADRACVVINRHRKLRAAGQNFFRQRFWDFDAPRAAEMSAGAVGDVSPAFEEDSADTIFDGDVQAA